MPRSRQQESAAVGKSSFPAPDPPANSAPPFTRGELTGLEVEAEVFRAHDLAEEAITGEEIVRLLDGFLLHLRHLEYSSKTISFYRLAAQRLMRRYPDLPFEAMTAEHIERHIYARLVSARSKDTELECLRPFFRFLVKHKRLLKANPCDAVEKRHGGSDSSAVERR